MGLRQRQVDANGTPGMGMNYWV